jgi:hypothetical protein
LKEVIRDPIKRGPFDPGGTLAENVVNPGPRVLPALGLQGLRSAGALPLALATAHQAPAAAAEASDNEDAALSLDAQLQSLADAIAETDAARQSLQEQYDETALLLAQTLNSIEEQQ